MLYSAMVVAYLLVALMYGVSAACGLCENLVNLGRRAEEASLITQSSVALIFGLSLIWPVSLLADIAKLRSNEDA